MFIRSERLFLRPGWPEDWSELSERIGDAAIVRNLGSTPWPYATADAKALLSAEQDRRCPRLVVTLPTSEGSELIGCTGLARGEAGVELGYWIARPHWGRGFATEAVRAILSLARTLGHRRIVARHFADNPGSARVLTKLGFKPVARQAPRISAVSGEKNLARSWALDLASPCGDDDPASRMASFAA